MPTRPQTGSDYLQSLDDVRIVIHDGERVERVAEHPDFAGTASTMASLYDSLHTVDAAANALLAPVADGPDVDGATHSFWSVPQTRGDVRAQREAIRGWQRQTRG